MSNRNDQIRCPRCGNAMTDRKSPCPHCGYAGYIPMSEAQIKRTKRILYPIFAVAAALVILAVWLTSK